MPNERYGVVETAEGHYVFDEVDQCFVGNAHTRKLFAEVEAEMMNRLVTSVRPLIYRRIDQERVLQFNRFGSGPRSSSEHLGILMKKVGDVASSLLEYQPRERELEQELVEVAAVVIQWLEALEAMR